MAIANPRPGGQKNPPSATATTAPVLEFGCLYTHDLRRKSKRWQDGFLRYHTFNKRVMVYDVPRNFIGDAHWRETGQLQDGDELTLDVGVLVQVGEATGALETDLTPLLERRRDQSAKRKPGVERTAGLKAVETPQVRHRSLNALLGTPKGPYGKAMIPVKSPFEVRRGAQNVDRDDGREVKRRKVQDQMSDGSPAIPRPDARPAGRKAPVSRSPSDDGIVSTSGRAGSKDGGINDDVSTVTLISSGSEEESSQVAFQDLPHGEVNRSDHCSKDANTAMHAPSRTTTDLSVESNKPSHTLNQQGQSRPKGVFQGVGQQDEPPRTLRIAAGRPRKMLFLQERSENGRPSLPGAERSAHRKAQQVAQRTPLHTITPESAPSRKNAARSEPTVLRTAIQRSTVTEVDASHQLDDELGAIDDDRASLSDEHAIQSSPEASPNVSELNSLNNQNITKQTPPPPKQPNTQTNSPYPSARPTSLPVKAASPRELRRVRSETDAGPALDPAPADVEGASSKTSKPKDGGAPPSLVADPDVGAWSSEALDFFDWRPPDWSTREQVIKMGLQQA